MTTDPRSPYDFRDRVVLVTGGSRGLGQEMVRAFARAGADTIIASRKLENCEALAEEVRRETGRRALPVACNVSRWNDVDALVEAAYAEFGKVDVLVNNAGASPLYDDVASVSEELYDKVLGLNLKGPFRLCALVGTRMVQGDGGSIINVSSNAATRPLSFSIPYSAAKAGVNAMTVAFARLFGPKVRVNCIQPGSYLTDISRHWDPEETAAEMQTVAMKRAGEPHEVVGAALYLASDAASYTTAAVLRVDGGCL